MTFSLLGIDIQTGAQVEIAQSSRRGGLYVIGATGTGKSTLLENLILQDITQGFGVCVIDPYGDLIPPIISQLPEKRLNDVILLDLRDTEYIFGLNLLTPADSTDEAFREYTVDRVMRILEKFYGLDSRSTPLMNYYLRNCIYTLSANPGYTLIDIPLLLMNEEVRISLVAHVTDPQVLMFWREYSQMEPRRRREVVSAVLNRAADLSRPLIRHIIGQSKTTINMREVMDEQKILLVKLNPHFGEVSSLISSMIISEMIKAAFSRTDVPATERKQFNFYADEFQSFASEDFVALLLDSRKFEIVTTIASQPLEQLGSLSKSAAPAMANIVVFRVTAQVAKELAAVFDAVPLSLASNKSFQEQTSIVQEEERQIVTALTLTHLPNFTAMVRILDAEGKPFEYTIKASEHRRGIDTKILRQRLYEIRINNIAQGYLRSRELIEEEITKRQEQHRIIVADATLDSPASIRIRINEEPLTARNIATILAALTRLHAKNWLIQQGRFVDLFEYTQTYDIRFDEEANLVIAQLTHNSPTIIELLITSTGAVTLAVALKMALDAVIGVWDRRRTLALKNKALEEEIEQKKQEAQSIHEEKMQHRQIEASEAYITFQKELVELEKQRLELQKEKLEFEVKRLEHASRAAVKIVDVLHPQADAATKAIAARSLVNNILELCEGKEIELLPAPQDKNNEVEVRGDNEIV